MLSKKSKQSKITGNLLLLVSVVLPPDEAKSAAEFKCGALPGQVYSTEDIKVSRSSARRHLNS